MALEFNMGRALWENHLSVSLHFDLLTRTLSNMGPNSRRFAGACGQKLGGLGLPNVGYFYPRVLEMTKLYCFLGATKT